MKLFVGMVVKFNMDVILNVEELLSQHKQFAKQNEQNFFIIKELNMFDCKDLILLSDIKTKKEVPFLVKENEIIPCINKRI